MVRFSSTDIDDELLLKLLDELLKLLLLVEVSLLEELILVWLLELVTLDERLLMLLVFVLDELVTISTLELDDELLTSQLYV